MTSMRSILTGLLVLTTLAATAGCANKKQAKYGREEWLFLPGTRAQVWAVAPAIDLSGRRGVDPILQADLLFEQLQQVKGLTVIPVNRVVETYAALGIDRVQSEQQAQIVCEALGCDGLLVPTVTIYDPYNPPKFGGALALFHRDLGGHGAGLGGNVDPRQLARQAAPPPGSAQPRQGSYVQVADMYDATNGSVLERLQRYAAGRYDPKGALGMKEYLVHMDRYVGFAYHSLIRELVARPQLAGWQ